MSYSQNLEEEIILDYFKDYRGNFIDIGSNDGMTLSNTYALIQKGWGGVYIEADPEAFKRLKFNIPERKGLYFYPYALADHNGETTMYQSSSLLKTGDVGLVSTLVKEETDRFKSVVQYNEITVKCFKWKTYVNRFRIKKFDFISLDIEGMDLTVLKDIDLTETKLVCVEWNGKDKEKYDALMSGFRLIHTNGENLIYGI